MEVSPGEHCFTSLTHGSHEDCRLANENLRETLVNYNFGAFLFEKSCTRCPNDDCNSSFILILNNREVLRLRRQVTFDVRPTFLVHNSFSELIKAEQLIRQQILNRNSVGTQVSAETANKMVDAVPQVVAQFSQTDFKIGRKDIGIQTANENEKEKDESENRVLPEIVPEMTSLVRSAEQEEEYSQEIIFVEMRRRDPSSFPLRPVKEEQQERTENQFYGNPTPKMAPPVSTPVRPSVAPIKREISNEEHENTSGLNSTTSSISNDPSISTPITPRNDESFEAPAKRIKFTENVSMCQMCFDVFNFTKLSEFCDHVLQHHVSLARFKCGTCGTNFISSVQAYNHSTSHSGEGDVHATVVSEISSAQIEKFHMVACKCFPDDFQNVSNAEIIAQIQTLQ